MLVSCPLFFRAVKGNLVFYVEPIMHWSDPCRRMVKKSEGPISMSTTDRPTG